MTYVLREYKEFSSTHCITFAPAACMTWDLAESGEAFITSVINGSDLVPTFSATAVDDLRAEVTASAWVNDFREQIERTRFLSTVYRSATALGSRLPSLAKASKARVASAGAIWRPVSSSTQVVMRQAQTMAQAVVFTRPSLGLSGWSCMGARRRTVSTTTTSSSPVEGESKALMSESSDSVESAVVHSSDIKTSECATSSSSSVEGNINSTWGRGADLSYSSAPDEEYIDHELDGEEEEDLITSDSIIDHSGEEDISEDYLWHRLEQELKRKSQVDLQKREEEAAVAKEIIEDEENVVATANEIAGHGSTDVDLSLSDANDSVRFYPPGRIMHIVSLSPSDSPPNGVDGQKIKVGIYLTRRSLYGKLRLSRTMINDHYMPVYKRMMEQLINELEHESEEDIMVDEIQDKEI